MKNTERSFFVHFYFILSVIGAGQNSFSSIRSRMASLRVSTSTVPNILTMYDPTPIEIIQTKGTFMHIYE